LGRLACFGALPGAFVLDVADRQPQQLHHRLSWGNGPGLNDLPQLIARHIGLPGAFREPGIIAKVFNDSLELVV
jgi:hypothetical protein